MSAVIKTDDRPDKSGNHYPASKKKNPPKIKDKKDKPIQQRSTLSFSGIGRGLHFDISRL